jgi:hypothetical protein
MTSKKKKDPQYFLHNGVVYQEIDHPLFTSAEKIKIPKRHDLVHWKGQKLPLELIGAVVNFFQEGFKKTKSENLVYLYYNLDLGKWHVWAPPQTCNGMTVKADSQSPEYKEQRKNIPKGYILFGTIHHHCSGTAFASGTDQDDEEDRDGLHITIGHIGSTNASDLDFHARATFQKATYPVDLEKWVEQPDWLQNAPEHLREDIFELLIKDPYPIPDFPKEWMNNLKEPFYQSTPNWSIQRWASPTLPGLGDMANKVQGTLITPQTQEPPWVNEDMEKLVDVAIEMNLHPEFVDELFERQEYPGCIEYINDDRTESVAEQANLEALHNMFMEKAEQKGLFRARIKYLMREYDFQSFYNVLAK